MTRWWESEPSPGPEPPHTGTDRIKLLLLFVFYYFVNCCFLRFLKRVVVVQISDGENKLLSHHHVSFTPGEHLTCFTPRWWHLTCFTPRWCVKQVRCSPAAEDAHLLQLRLSLTHVTVEEESSRWRGWWEMFRCNVNVNQFFYIKRSGTFYVPVFLFCCCYSVV